MVWSMEQCYTHTYVHNCILDIHWIAFVSISAQRIRLLHVDTLQAMRKNIDFLLGISFDMP